MTQGYAVEFNNGLTEEEHDVLDELQLDIVRMMRRVEALGRHRSYSLAVTKLEEASLWLGDRRHKEAS